MEISKDRRSVSSIQVSTGTKLWPNVQLQASLTSLYRTSNMMTIKHYHRPRQTNSWYLKTHRQSDNSSSYTQRDTQLVPQIWCRWKKKKEPVGWIKQGPKIKGKCKSKSLVNLKPGGVIIIIVIITEPSVVSSDPY